MASVAGRSQRYNSFQIDGAVNNDLFGLAAGGGAPGGNAGTQPISLDAVQEIQLVVSSYDVRQSGFSGGGINAITKSGTNQLHGSLFYFDRDQSLVGTGITKVPVSTFGDKQGGFTLGGKILENRAFFFGTLDGERKQTPSGFSIGSTGVQFGNDALVTRFLGDLKTLYGYDLGGSAKDEYTKANSNDKFFGRVDFNLGASQLTVRHNYVSAFSDTGSPSTTSYVLPDGFYRFNSKTHSTVSQLTSRFLNSVNQLRVALTTVRESRDPEPGFETPFPFVSVTLFGSTSIKTGRENFSGANQLDQTVVEITDDLTRLIGAHQITVGTHNELFQFRNLFIRDFYGNYTFNSLDLFEQGLAQGYSRSFSATSDPLQPAKFRVNQFGFYAGDQWRVASNLTLTYGTRIDLVRYPTKPDSNPVALATFGYSTAVVPNNTMWSPRAGFNYLLNSNGTEQIRGGIGLFAGRTPYVWISNQFGNTGIDFTRLSISTAAANRIPFVADPANQPTSLAGLGASTNEIDLIDPQFKYPSVVRTNLAYDRDLGGGWSGTAEFLYTKVVNDIRYENLNYAPTGTLALDGRPIFTKQVASLSDVLVLTNTDKGKAYTISLEARRPFKNRLFLDIAYLFGHSKTIMDGTRDQAVSTWGNVYTPGNVNDPPLTTSDYDPGHRINVTGSYELPLGAGYSATFSLFYSGQSGRPYTLLWGSPGVNGDGQSFNDNLYLPASARQGVTFTNGTFQDLLNFLQGQSCTANQLGQIMARNSCRAPWTNTLDGHFALKLPFQRTRAEITLDVLNLLNLIDSSKGVFRYAAFNDVTPVGETLSGGQVTVINLATLNSPTFSAFTRGDLRSRWQMQIGARLRF